MYSHHGFISENTTQIRGFDLPWIGLYFLQYIFNVDEIIFCVHLIY